MNVALASTQLDERVRAAWERARKVRETAPWEDIVRRAWEALYSRLLDYVTTGSDRPVEASELVCAARGVGPATLLPLQLTAVSLWDWTGALLHCLDPENAVRGDGTRIAEISRPPLWLAVFALGRLGTGNLAPEWADRLVSFLIARAAGSDTAEDTSPDVRRIRALTTQQGGVWRGQRAAAKAVLVVRRARNSLTNTWTASPAHGFAMVMTAAQLHSVLRKVVLLKEALPAMTIALEQPLDSAADDEQVQDDIETAKLTTVPILRLYARAGVVMQGPSLVGPKQIDEVISPTSTVSA